MPVDNVPQRTATATKAKPQPKPQPSSVALKISILQQFYNRLPIRKKYIKAIKKGTLIWDKGQVPLPSSGAHQAVANMTYVVCFYRFAHLLHAYPPPSCSSPYRRKPCRLPAPTSTLKKTKKTAKKGTKKTAKKTAKKRTKKTTFRNSGDAIFKIDLFFKMVHFKIDLFFKMVHFKIDLFFKMIYFLKWYKWDTPTRACAYYYLSSYLPTYLPMRREVLVSRLKSSYAALGRYTYRYLPQFAAFPNFMTFTFDAQLLLLTANGGRGGVRFFRFDVYTACHESTYKKKKKKKKTGVREGTVTCAPPR
ncbi:conserved Plasmodium protein, unknown function [Plasmodium ovale wallikeri]|uniref:Uncharacterized protein n=1 Tax=Plasmodium ovale wallikeri TaxID=864142 RepID=A0A1A8YSJ0_PLAOA|nr:conserved Plasmodium protein, unknown function [Plasmodium ovale wallikeri]